MDVQAAAIAVDAAFKAGVGVGVCAGVVCVLVFSYALRWWQERRP